MKTLLTACILFLAMPAFAQYGGDKSNTIPAGAAPTTVTYDGINCAMSGGAATETCTFGSNPAAGTAVVGSFFIFGTSSTVVSVCDGTGATGCTGSSSYTVEPILTNSTNFVSYLFFTCDYVGTGGGVISVTQVGTGGMYGTAVVGTGNTTSGTGCNDGYNHVINTTAGTSCQTPTVTTTNGHDMLVGFSIIPSGAGTYTVGVDGQGHTFTQRADASGADFVQTINEASALAYYSAGSWTSSNPNNCYVFAVK